MNILDETERDLKLADRRGRELIDRGYERHRLRNETEAQILTGAFSDAASVSTEPNTETERLIAEGRALQRSDRLAVIRAAQSTIDKGHEELITQFDRAMRPALEAYEQLAHFEARAAALGASVRPTTATVWAQAELSTRYRQWAAFARPLAAVVAARAPKPKLSQQLRQLLGGA